MTHTRDVSPVDRWWEQESPSQCSSVHHVQRVPNDWIEVRCRKPAGHRAGLHMSDPLYPIDTLEVVSWL